MRNWSQHDCAPLSLEPDFQRGHVWTDEQRTAYVEYGLMGGECASVVISNCWGWINSFVGPHELVDGLQRITAVRKFMSNEIKAFGTYYRDFTEELRFHSPSFRWRVTTLQTRAEVLKFYLVLNTGGTVHSKEAIEKVKRLLEKEIR